MERPAVAGKKKKVKKLTEKLEKAVSFYIVDFTGLDANKMNSLRGRFRKSNYEYFVTKNSILKLASDNLGFEEISKVLTGPNSISISYEDPIGPARIIMDFSKESKLPTVKLCCIEGKWFTSDDVKKIADLPSRDVLIGQFLNLLNSPISLFVTLLRNILGNLVRVVDEIGKKKASEEKPEKKAEEAKDEKQEDKVKEGEKEEVVKATEKEEQVEEAKEEKQVDEPKEDGKLIEEVRDEKQEDKAKEDKKEEVVKATEKEELVKEAKEKKRTDVVKEVRGEKQLKEVKKRKKSKEMKKTDKKILKEE